MKRLLFISALLTALGTSAQVDQSTDLEDRQEDAQDRLQQEPPRATENAVERAVRATNINTQNSQNVISAEDRLKSELERSTGKPDNNPARNNPQTVRPVRVADPPSSSGQR